MDMLYGLAGGGVVGVIAVVFGLCVMGYFKRLMSERDKLVNDRQNNWDSQLSDLSKTTTVFLGKEGQLDQMRADLDELSEKLNAHLQDDSPEKTEKEFASLRGE